MCTYTEKSKLMISLLDQNRSKKHSGAMIYRREFIFLKYNKCDNHNSPCNRVNNNTEIIKKILQIIKSNFFFL